MWAESQQHRKIVFDSNQKSELSLRLQVDCS